MRDRLPKERELRAKARVLSKERRMLQRAAHAAKRYYNKKGLEDHVKIHEKTRAYEWADDAVTEAKGKVHDYQMQTYLMCAMVKDHFYPDPLRVSLSLHHRTLVDDQTKFLSLLCRFGFEANIRFYQTVETLPPPVVRDTEEFFRELCAYVQFSQECDRVVVDKGLEYAAQAHVQYAYIALVTAIRRFEMNERIVPMIRNIATVEGFSEIGTSCIRRLIRLTPSWRHIMTAIADAFELGNPTMMQMYSVVNDCACHFQFTNMEQVDVDRILDCLMMKRSEEPTSYSTSVRTIHRRVPVRLQRGVVMNHALTYAHTKEDPHDTTTNRERIALMFMVKAQLVSTDILRAVLNCF
jgi:hypothetical protein